MPRRCVVAERQRRRGLDEPIADPDGAAGLEPIRRALASRDTRRTPRRRTAASAPRFAALAVRRRRPAPRRPRGRTRRLPPRAAPPRTSRRPSSTKMRRTRPNTRVRSKRRFSRSRTRSRACPSTRVKTRRRSGCPASARATRASAAVRSRVGPVEAAVEVTSGGDVRACCAKRPIVRSSIIGSSASVGLSSLSSSRQRSPKRAR